MLINYKLFICLSLLVLFNNVKCETETSYYDAEFDFIILGAGTAGSIVANKLSENKKYTVLLVEEGGYAQHPWIWSTKNWLDHFMRLDTADPVITRVFKSSPQIGLNNRTVNLLRAKVTGGCGMHNGMVVVVGEKHMYNRWAQETGESEWGWENIASKHITEIRSKFYLRKLDDSRYLLPEIKQAALDAGLKFDPDVYDGKLNGLTNRITMTKPDSFYIQKREATYSTYIDPVAAKRNNLEVLVYHRAEKIEFSGNKATSVRLRDVGTGKVRNIRIKKELVVSLGAYESPVLLQSSGIGDPAKLSSLGITPVIDSPFVGEGLIDHIYLGFFGKPLFANISVNPADLDRNTVSDGFLYFGSKEKKPEHDYIIGLDFAYFGPGQVYFNCPVELVNSTSTGRVKLSKVDNNGAAVQPLIESNFITTQSDLDILKDGIKMCRKIQEKLVKKGLIDDSKPEYNSVGSSEESIEQYIRNKGSSDSHPHATIRMGKWSDPAAPLDPHLKVKGTKNVRVIDASVAPSVINVNTNIPTMIIALQGSEFILNEIK